MVDWPRHETEAADEPGHGQPLHNDGKGHDRKRNDDDLLPLRNVLRERHGQRQGERSAKNAPDEHVLISEADAEGRWGEQETQRVDREHPTDQHERNRDRSGSRKQGNRLMRLVTADQDENNGVRQESRLLPER